jgi:ABC-type bacteriocin/lantibiotic exporter with double-glycine peptidase domain
MKFALAHTLHIWNDGAMLFLFAVASTAPHVPIFSQYEQLTLVTGAEMQNAAAPVVPSVPFFSQFKDITLTKWQKVGCGVASLAMIIDFYEPDTVSTNTLLKQGIAAGAYLQNAGWTYAGLIKLSKKYGLDGNSYDLGKSTSADAFTQFKKHLKAGPLIASVHYKFDPKSTIPHLVVITGINGDTLSYNDPAAKTGDKQISTADFLRAWKKRFIVIRPVTSTLSLLPASPSKVFF